MLFANVTLRLLGSDDFSVDAKRKAARDLTTAAAAGAVAIEIGQRYPLEQIAAAHDRVDAGRPRTSPDNHPRLALASAATASSITSEGVLAATRCGSDHGSVLTAFIVALPAARPTCRDASERHSRCVSVSATHPTGSFATPVTWVALVHVCYLVPPAPDNYHHRVSRLHCNHHIGANRQRY
jgi:hypothetical protein